jgi:hypothetical protein
MSKNKAKLTVALPLWRSRDIAWLAMEGLCRQKEVDFEWELLIIEENYREKIRHRGDYMFSVPYCLGKDEVMKYSDRLRAAGCARVEYTGIREPSSKLKYKTNKKGGIHLSNKWTAMARSASEHSLCFLLQAGDNYPQPYRLKETYDLFLRDDCDWAQSPRGIFYNFENKQALMFDVSGSASTGLNMAVKTELLRKVPDLNISRTVDSKILKNIQKIKADSGGELKRSSSISQHWNEGLWTHGANSISHGRWDAAEKALSDEESFWREYKEDPLRHIPSYVKERLESIDLSGSRSWKASGVRSSSADLAKFQKNK